MLAIRMRKMGSKKRPFFRVVVIDSRVARDGSFVEIVGHYNPRTKPAKVEIDRERIEHWVGKGAQLSDTVRTLLKRHAAKPAPASAEASASAHSASADKTAGRAVSA